MLRTVFPLLISGLSLGASSLPAQELEALFRQAEARLVEADEVSMVFQVTAEGAVSASLEGSLRREGDRELELRASGTFAGQEVDLHLTVDGETMTWGNGETSSEGPVPAELWSALAVGITRMGILHNLARLVGGAPPDHAEGGVTEWVTVGDFRGAPGDHPFPDVQFDLTVAGQPSGRAVMTVYEGLPAGRLQTVAFPQGEMHVEESYSYPASDSATAR